MKIVIEDVVRPDEVSKEDAGQSLIWTSKSFPEETDDTPDDDPGIFFRFHSWDERARTHDVFRQFVGKKVRITIESLEVLDQLSEIE